MNEILEVILVSVVIAIIIGVCCYLTLGALPIWECGYQLAENSCRLPPWG